MFGITVKEFTEGTRLMVGWKKVCLFCGKDLKVDREKQCVYCGASSERGWKWKLPDGRVVERDAVL